MLAAFITAMIFLASPRPLPSFSMFDRFSKIWGVRYQSVLNSTKKLYEQYRRYEKEKNGIRLNEK